MVLSTPIRPELYLAKAKKITLLVEGGITGDYEITYITDQAKRYTRKKLLNFLMNGV